MVLALLGGPMEAKTVALLVVGLVVGLVAMGAMVLGLGLLWAVVEVWWLMMELAVAVLWWSVRWALVQLLWVVSGGWANCSGCEQVREGTGSAN